MIVNTLLRETAGQNLKAEIHFDDNDQTYNVKYYINGCFQADRQLGKTDRISVEEHAKGWIDSVGVLKG